MNNHVEDGPFNPFNDDMVRLLEKGMRDLGRDLGLPEGTHLTYDQTPLTVHKAVAYLPISDELLHPERYPMPAVTWRTRLRWRWREAKYRVRLAVLVLRRGDDAIRTDDDW